MKNFNFLFICLALFLNNFILAEISPSSSVEQTIIKNPNQKENTIEFFVQKPKGKGPFPVVFLLHGYQKPENSTGGKQLSDYGYLDRFVREGIVAVSISIPGYGNSTGSRDFAGPNSQKAILAVIEHFKTIPFIEPSKMGIYGFSRGAVLAGMVSSCSPDISLQILDSGFYDLISFFLDTPGYLEGIKNSIIQEGGNTPEALIERSPIYHTDSTNAATLMIQGEFDDRRQLAAAEFFQEKLRKKGIESQLKIYSGGHGLPAEKWEAVIPFIREHFFDLYGIGINVSEASPAIQILKILPDSSAFKSGKLKAGDVILSISPLNDDVEIPLLGVPRNIFISLALGAKGSSLRLHVQHFDFSFEDIVLQRI